MSKSINELWKDERALGGFVEGCISCMGRLVIEHGASWLKSFTVAGM